MINYPSGMICILIGLKSAVYSTQSSVTLWRS